MSTVHTLLDTGAGLTNLPNEQAKFYNRNLLERLKPQLIHGKFARKFKLPKGFNTMDVRRIERLTPNQSPSQLAEGVTPASSALSVTKYTFAPKQYGDFATVSDRLQSQAVDPIITEFTDVFGQYGGETFDIIIRNCLAGNGSLQYVNGNTVLTDIGEGDILTVAEVKKAVRTLRRNSVRTFSNGKYVTLIHPDTEHDLTNDTDWKDLNIRQNNGKNVYDYQVGTLQNTEVFSSPQAQIQRGAGATITTGEETVRVTAHKADVYSTYVFGEEAFGTCDLEADDMAKPKTIVILANGQNTTDPLNQRSTVGYKGMIDGIVLQELALIEIRHSAKL